MAANAQQVAFPVDEVGAISENILGLTARQAVAVSNNGWNNITDFADFTTDDIESWTKSIARLPVNRGGTTFPSVRTKRLCALTSWVNRRLLRGVALVAADFDPAALTESLAAYPILDMQKNAADTNNARDLRL